MIPVYVDQYFPSRVYVVGEVMFVCILAATVSGKDKQMGVMGTGRTWVDKMNETRR
jgi:hypothetical protein